VLTHAALAAALLLSAAPLRANAGEAAPIAVGETITNNGNWDPWSHYRDPNNVIVTFKNIAAQTVTNVIFAVFDQDGIVRGRIGDRGSFAPGVAIKHIYNNCYDSFAPVTVTLVAVEAAFADGSTWKAPQTYDFANLSCP
jgi:hypothetical protein